MRENGRDRPLVLEAKGNSLDDGPGIRSVIFFKGCPLSCLWCHNPESKRATAELAFDPRKCVGCGTCRDECTEDALSPENPYYVDRDTCTLCFHCVDTCPSGALERVGKYLSAEQVLDSVLRDRTFYDVSGGGVTLSGGEPTLYMEFAASLAEALHHQGIHTLLETCGYFDLADFTASFYPYLDAIYFDLKLIDRSDHKKYCGVSNEKILENFTQLSRMARSDGKVLLPRVPLVPGITDTDANIRDTALFLKGLDINEVALLSYNPLWHEKLEKLGEGVAAPDNQAMRIFPEEDIMARCKALLLEAGITARR